MWPASVIMNVEPPKSWLICTRLQGITFQKIQFLAQNCHFSKSVKNNY
jgi:hypothetical protein